MKQILVSIYIVSTRAITKKITKNSEKTSLKELKYDTRNYPLNTKKTKGKTNRKDMKHRKQKAK